MIASPTASACSDTNQPGAFAAVGKLGTIARILNQASRLVLSAPRLHCSLQVGSRKVIQDVIGQLRHDAMCNGPVVSSIEPMCLVAAAGSITFDGSICNLKRLDFPPPDVSASKVNKHKPGKTRTACEIP